MVLDGAFKSLALVQALDLSQSHCIWILTVSPTAHAITLMTLCPTPWFLLGLGWKLRPHCTDSTGNAAESWLPCIIPGRSANAHGFGIQKWLLELVAIMLAWYDVTSEGDSPRCHYPLSSSFPLPGIIMGYHSTFLDREKALMDSPSKQLFSLGDLKEKKKSLHFLILKTMYLVPTTRWRMSMFNDARAPIANPHVIQVDHTNTKILYRWWLLKKGWFTGASSK